MPHLIFHLHNVPDDEADDVRSLLQENQIDFYETSAGRWKIGLAAIWLPNNLQKLQAESLLDAYQKKRYQDFTEHREHLKKLGTLSSMQEKLYTQPLQFIAAITGIIIVLAISVLPFF